MRTLGKINCQLLRQKLFSKVRFLGQRYQPLTKHQIRHYCWFRGNIAFHPGGPQVYSRLAFNSQILLPSRLGRITVILPSSSTGVLIFIWLDDKSYLFCLWDKHCLNQHHQEVVWDSKLKSFSMSKKQEEDKATWKNNIFQLYILLL